MKYFHLTYLFAIVILWSCQSSNVTQAIPDEHTSKSALDWDGVYHGTLPCTDCVGKQTRITIRKDQSYILETFDLDKSTSVAVASGGFNWDKTGAIITLENQKGEPWKMKVVENGMIKLQANGKAINGELSASYRLQKDLGSIVGKHWKLIELRGQPFVNNKETHKEVFLEFMENNRFTGNNGCNVLNGNYEITGTGEISIGLLATTRMACPGITTDSEINELLNKVDNYSLKDGILSLNKGRMAPLARFKEIYFQQATGK